jgi:hypothetical protein
MNVTEALERIEAIHSQLASGEESRGYPVRGDRLETAS